MSTSIGPNPDVFAYCNWYLNGFSQNSKANSMTRRQKKEALNDNILNNVSKDNVLERNGCCYIVHGTQPALTKVYILIPPKRLQTKLSGSRHLILIWKGNIWWVMRWLNSLWFWWRWWCCSFYCVIIWMAARHSINPFLCVLFCLFEISPYF